MVHDDGIPSHCCTCVISAKFNMTANSQNCLAEYHHYDAWSPTLNLTDPIAAEARVKLENRLLAMMTVHGNLKYVAPTQLVLRQRKNWNTNDQP